MKNLNFSSILLLLTMAFGVVSLTSCKDDPIMGCTNPASSNYNADADEDDGSCIIDGCNDADADNFDADANNDDGSCTYFGLYEGNYVGTFACAGTLAALFSSADAEIIKVADPNVVSVIVMAESLPTDVPVTTLIETKNQLTLSQSLPGVLLEIIPNPNDPNGGVFPGTTFDITVTGTLDRMDNGDLEGPLTFDLVEVSGIYPAGTFDFEDTCVYTAVKQ